MQKDKDYLIGNYKIHTTSNPYISNRISFKNQHCTNYCLLDCWCIDYEKGTVRVKCDINGDSYDYNYSIVEL